MQRDHRLLLHDVATASNAIRQFTDRRTLADYDNDLMLRSACERQFEIIGEAMTRLRDHHVEVFERIPDGRAIIALRNRLIHGYDAVDSAIIWDVISRKLPELAQNVEILLNGAP